MSEVVRVKYQAVYGDQNMSVSDGDVEIQTTRAQTHVVVTK